MVKNGCGLSIHGTLILVASRMNWRIKLIHLCKFRKVASMIFGWAWSKRGMAIRSDSEIGGFTCNFTEDNAPPCVFFFTFFKLSKWHQIVQIHSPSVPIQQKLSDPKFAELLIITFDGIRSTMENISIWKRFFEKH